MTTGLHLPTAIVVATTLVLLWVLGQVIVRARRPRGGFLSDADRATHETLHTASLAARELREGLDDSGVTRAAPHLRAMLGTPSIAVCDPTGPIVWEGVGEHHLTSAHGHAEQARRIAEARDRLPAVALPDDYLGEKLCAAVVFAGAPITLADLNSFLDSRGVSAHTRPDMLAALPTLPKTAVGKVDKKAITRAIAAAPA